MGKRQKKRIRRALLQRRRVLLQRRHECLLLERALEEPVIGDEGDAAVSDRERSLLERLKEFEVGELRAVQRALARLEHDEYDHCEVCGRTIRTQRLVALPETNLCVDCASRYGQNALQTSAAS